jgi:glyoxylase-like metal-dependent hydrolase (beta-lactamase superfamily II)
MHIADGVEALELQATNFMGVPSIIHPTLFRENGSAILVDTGFPGLLPQIREAVEQTGLQFSKLDSVVITHHDLDHIGSLATIRDELPESLDILAHAGERPYIQGDLSPIKQTPERTAQREAHLNTLPEEQRTFLKALLAVPTSAKVDRTLADAEVLPFAGGITVIHTPGHTPGHICLYHARSKTLVTGDALNLINGKLTGPNPVHTYDLALALDSLKKLAAYDIENVICYHGGVYRGGDANRRIAELAEGQN